MDKIEAKLQEIKGEMRGAGFRWVKVNEWGIRCVVTKKHLQDVLLHTGWGKVDHLDDFVKISFGYEGAKMHLKNGNNREYWKDVMNYLRAWIGMEIEEEISAACEEEYAAAKDFFDEEIPF